MAKLSKVDAAKAAGVSRQTLYTYIKDGRISIDANGLVDTAELLRAGFTLHEVGRPISVSSGHALTSSMDTVDLYRQMIALLQHQLAEGQAQAQAREKDYQARIAWLEQHIDQIQQRYDRLLEAPRISPVASPSITPQPSQDVHPVTELASIPQAWQRIIDYLRTVQKAVTPHEVQQALRLDHTPRHMMNRMVQRGMLQRLALGVYRLEG